MRCGEGAIGCFKFFGQQVYMFFPFAIGIYEFQLNRLDKQFVDLFEKYAPTFLTGLGGFKPAYTRVIPVNAKIDPQLQVHLYEDLHRIIDQSKSFRVQDCICRKERPLRDVPVSIRWRVAWPFPRKREPSIISPWPEGLFPKKSFPGIVGAEKEGLVHCSWNVQQGHRFVCNCCPCLLWHPACG